MKKAEKAKEHDVAVIRQKSKIDSKGKKHKKARKAKYATVKKTLNVKSKKHPIKITVLDNSISKGLVVKDDETSLFKTSKDNYAIVNKGAHKFSIAAAKKNKEGTASIKVETVQASKKIAKKYILISSTVKHSDAQELCERFGANLAEVKAKDMATILKKAKSYVEAGVTEVWIDRLISEDDSFSYLPTILNLSTGESEVDPDGLFTSISDYSTSKLAKLPDLKNKKKYKKAYAKAQAKIRKLMDKALDKKDKTVPRAVFCRLD